MDLAAFKDRLDRWGDDVDRWPAGEAEAARALLAASPEAALLHAEAQHLAALLAAPPRPRAPAGLLDRILAAARQSDARPSDTDTSGPDDEDAGPSGTGTR